MRYDEFVGQVQHRAHLADGGQAVRAIHATLETLGERLVGGEARDLATQLPPEIGYYLHSPNWTRSSVPQKFDLEEFFDRVAMREDARIAQAMHHAQAVIAVLCDAVSPGEIKDVRAQLPHEFDRLFDVWKEGDAAPHGRA